MNLELAINNYIATVLPAIVGAFAVAGSAIFAIFALLAWRARG